MSQTENAFNKSELNENTISSSGNGPSKTDLLHAIPDEKKQNSFLSALNQTANKAAKGSDGKNILFVSKILREANNDQIMKAVASNLAGGSVDVSDTFLDHADAYALANVIREIPAPIKSLALRNCHINSDKFLSLGKAIKAMPGSIEKLSIADNYLTGIDEIFSLLHKVEKVVDMCRCFDDCNGGRRSANLTEKRVLQEALDSLENTKLEIFVDEIGSGENARFVTIKHKSRMS